ncbi:MAG: hypothetical protein R3C46_14050 [Hyphomonadaceae bacterium]
MGLTVDHLESHHRYRVIRGFTDANGVRVPFAAEGVIRAMRLSPDMREIEIDWEPDGAAPVQLAFLLAATDGPRNNHMRTYFEKGDVSLPPRAPKPAAASQSPAPDPEPAQPKKETSLGEITVACGCDPAFHRAVWPPAQLSVNACLSCGAVTVSRQVGDDGRFTGKAWTAYWPEPTPQAVVDWLGRFPRVSVNHAGAPWRWPMSATLVRYPTLVYPADTRVSDKAELKTLEAGLTAEQAGLPRAFTFGRALADIPAPPPGLPEAFKSFLFVHETALLREDSNPDLLRRHASLYNPASELAADLLLRRPDAYGLMMGWLVSADDRAFGAGIAMLRDARRLFAGPDDPRLAPQILRIMDSLPLGPLRDVPNRVESCARLEAFLVAIADLGAGSAAMLEGLQALARKIGGRDSYTVDAIRIVINELNGVDNRPAEYR